MQYSLHKRYSDYANVHQICKEVLAVSDPLGIQSVLIGGSLLGMIRDGDFLPWDKDLDFAIFEPDIRATLQLEKNYRSLGYECRIHHLGVREPHELSQGMTVLKQVCSQLNKAEVDHALVHGSLINIVRDGSLFAETDGLTVLIDSSGDEADCASLIAALSPLGDVFINDSDGQRKGLTLVTPNWRVNLPFYCELDEAWGWLDLNCEHRFSAPLFPSQTVTNDSGSWRVPANVEDVLIARFGANWNRPSHRRFTRGRVPGSMQLYKNGVMFDFIFHYVRGEKTLWFEPAANEISTIGFLPATPCETTAGRLLIPDQAAVFLTEHYGNWKVPVKTWDGAVDNPTIINGDSAMDRILQGLNIR